MSIKLNNLLTRFVSDTIMSNNYVTTGVVTDLIKYKKTPEGPDDTNRPDYKALVEIKGERQLIVKIASDSAGQVLRGTETSLTKIKHSYGKLRFPEKNDRVIILFPRGNQGNGIIVGRYFGDETLESLGMEEIVPSITEHEMKDIHISGTYKSIDKQGNVTYKLEGHTIENNVWSTTTSNKSFTIQNKSGTFMRISDSNVITITNSSGAGLSVYPDGTLILRGKLIKFQKVT